MTNTLRQRMIDDMDLAGLSVQSRETYLHAVGRLVTQTWKGIEELTEDEVRAYFLNLRDNGAAKGTFKTNWHGVKFLYEQTLGRDWPLFGKKRSGNPDKNGFPRH
ncbi:MAG: phage integrase N-terminal SAM-like domain-containing protein [Magnetococcales bacterium]|nr:phage integrase N-terminal SAM-like domain-containing protein [Magnetococcales bacterium]